MISGADLAEWLNDRSRQDQSGAAAEQLAGRWRGHPLFTEIKAEIAAMEVKSGSDVMAVAERFLARTDEIGALVRDMVAAARSEPFFKPPFIVINSEINIGFLLHSEPCLTIALGFTSADSLAAKKSGPRGPTSIGFTGLLTTYRWLKAGNATLSFWEAEPAGADFVGERAGRCRFVERRRIKDGKQFLVDGRYQSFVIEHATSDMICLQAAVHVDAAPLSVEYDSRTYDFVGASSADEASSRIEMMVTLLRLMERGDVIPEIAKLLDSPHFYTRWYVMREFLAMDAEAALPYLERMAAADPHPEVRDAARQTLALFFEPQEEAA